MKRIVLFMAVLLAVFAAHAQIAPGKYTVSTWQVANSKEVITDGVFPTEVMAQLTVDDDFIIFSIYGYSSALFLQGEWKQQEKYSYCFTSTYKEKALVTLMLEKLEDIDDSWTLSIYYNDNHIERLGFYKKKQN